MRVFSYVAHEDDSRNLLRAVSLKLFEKGIVKESYIDAVVKREEKFPTGLQGERGINVAIPHADVQHVNKEALVIIRPAKGKHLLFKRMDEPSQTIPINLVLLLVVMTNEGYVKFLSELVSLINDEEFVSYVKQDAEKEIISTIVNKVVKHHFILEDEVTNLTDDYSS